MKRLPLVTCLIASEAFAAAQNSGKPPSSKPLSSNPSLDSSLTLIQNKVNEQGEIRYSMTSQGNTVSGETVQDKYIVETSKAVADVRSCALQVDARMLLNGKTQAQGRPTMQFRDITSVSVKSQSQAIGEKTAQAGITQWKGKIAPKATSCEPFRQTPWLGCSFFGNGRPRTPSPRI